MDFIHAGAERVFADVQHPHIEAGLGTYMRDTASHLSGADNANRLDVYRHSRVLLAVKCGVDMLVHFSSVLIFSGLFVQLG